MSKKEILNNSEIDNKVCVFAQKEQTGGVKGSQY